MRKNTGLFIIICCTIATGGSALANDMSGWLIKSETAEAALALSAAPENVTAEAGLYVLSIDGYRPVRDSKNGFNCLVERSFAAPEQAPVRAPICYDTEASKTVMQMKMVIAKEAMGGGDKKAVQLAAHAAFASGKVRAPTHAAFAYMFSADQYLGEQAGAFLPHMMIYAPYYDNDKLGGNMLGSNLPQLFEKPGTAFSTAVIPVDPALTIKSK